MMKILFALLIWPLLGVLLLFSGLGCDNGGQLASSNMSPGERLYRARCSACHRLRDPKSQTDDEWPEYVEEYGKKLTAEEKAIILTYLQSNN